LDLSQYHGIFTLIKRPRKRAFVIPLIRVFILIVYSPAMVLFNLETLALLMMVILFTSSVPVIALYTTPAAVSMSRGNG